MDYIRIKLYELDFDGNGLAAMGALDATVAGLQRPGFFFNHSSLQKAIKNEHKEVAAVLIKAFSTPNAPGEYRTYASDCFGGDYLCGAGCLAALKELDPHTSKFSGQAFIEARKFGHDDVVEWLVEELNRRRDATPFGEAGELELLQRHHLTLNVTSTCLDEAAQKGHLEVLEFLVEEYGAKVGMGSVATTSVAQSGHVHILHFLHENESHIKGLQFSTDCMDWAAASGRLDVMLFLYTHRAEGASSGAQKKMKDYKQREAAKLLREWYGPEMCGPGLGLPLPSSGNSIKSARKL